MSVKFKPYRRGVPNDSRDIPNVNDEGHALHCPKCDFEYVHVFDVRLSEGPYDGRPSAEVAFECEEGHQTTVIFGNYKGLGYCHWVEGTEWSSKERLFQNSSN